MNPTESCHGTVDRPVAAATSAGIVACGFPNVALALSRGFQIVRLAMEGKLTVRVSTGWWRCQHMDSLLRAGGSPPDQVSAAALNVGGLRSVRTERALGDGANQAQFVTAVHKTVVHDADQERSAGRQIR
jgi:hypothetical protein